MLAGGDGYTSLGKGKVLLISRSAAVQLAACVSLSVTIGGGAGRSGCPAEGSETKHRPHVFAHGVDEQAIEHRANLDAQCEVGPGTARSPRDLPVDRTR